MARALKWLTALTSVVLALCLAVIVLCGRDPDWNGTVLLRWNPQQRTFEFMRQPRPALDGPYVFREGSGYRVVDVRPANDEWQPVSHLLPAAPLPNVPVCTDGGLARCFQVPLRPPAQVTSADIASNPPRLLMLSDFEGQFDRFVALLQSQGVIDRSLRWSYGNGSMAIAGDMVDRGEHVVPLLWLIYRLEAEAAHAGGRVHYVLGNHEQMLLRGDMESWPERMRASAQRIEGGSRHLFSEASVLGQWLRTKPVIARIGDHLLVHGGVSTDLLGQGLSVTQANALARPYLETRTLLLPARVKSVLGRSGVTRYRGLAVSKHQLEPDVAAHLNAIAARYGVKRLAIGHTISPDIVLEHDGRLLRLDVHHKTQTPQAALYEGGRLWRVYADGRKVSLQ